MPTPTRINYGHLRGTVYDFSVEGDVLPMHWHKPDNSHITIVARGSFRAQGPDWQRIVSSGDVINWEPYKMHEFVALEDNSRIVNIVTGPGESISETGEITV